MRTPHTLRAQMDLVKKLRDVYDYYPDYDYILYLNYKSFLRPGSVVVDVGANIGVHTNHFLRQVWPQGQVIAVEPIAELAAGLQDKFKNVGRILEVHNVALSSYTGTSEFVRAEGALALSGLKERVFTGPSGATLRKIQVPVRTLDELTAALPRVDYVKMDIEGGEIDCLKGGQATLDRFRPLVSVEYGHHGYEQYGYQRSELWNVAKKHNYEITDIFGNHIMTAAEWDQTCDQVYWDWFLIPTEKLNMFIKTVNSKYLWLKALSMFIDKIPLSAPRSSKPLVRRLLQKLPTIDSSSTWLGELR